MNMIDRFRDLHREGCFVLPNPWDLGSARRLEAMGFSALATTSSGHAESLGRHDQDVTRSEMLEHAAQMVASVGVPFNIDSERLFSENLQGVSDTVEAIAATGAAGCSIEDYRPETDTIDSIDVAADRVRAAADASARSGIVLTARAEGFLYGSPVLDDVIERLLRFSEAGADVVYAPGLRTLPDIQLVVRSVDRPVNVLLWPGGPHPSELAGAGVRRISTGGALMRVAYAGMTDAASNLVPDSGWATDR